MKSIQHIATLFGAAALALSLGVSAAGTSKVTPTGHDASAPQDVDAQGHPSKVKDKKGPSADPDASSNP